MRPKDHDLLLALLAADGGVVCRAALLAGVLGTWLGVVPTMWIGAVGQLLAGLCVVIGPFWTMRELPDAQH